jgi:predicted deacetylase
VLIVAIHDVAPSTLGEVEWLLRRLDALGVDRRVLKVVPAEPGAGDDAPLVALLRREAERGSEIVLHGWTHRADAPPRGGSLADRLRARAFAAEAAELLALPDDEVRHRVAAGCDWLARHGLSAVGYCPPGWLATDGLIPALGDAGFRYLVTLRGLRDLRRRRTITLPPEGYMGAGAVQERLVRLGGTVLSRPLRVLLRVPAHRVFLHPQAASRSAACAAALTRLARIARDHRPIVYADLLDA